MTSTYDLWYALAPGNLVVTEIRIERLWPALWDPVLLALLQVPAWLLTGAPGLALVWYCHPNRIMSPEAREEYERQCESLFVIDELSSRARLDENYDPHEDDRAPSHLMFDLDKDEDEDIRNSVYASDVPAGYPGLDYEDEYLHDLERERQATEELMAEAMESEQARINDGPASSDPKPRQADDAISDDVPPHKTGSTNRSRE